MIILMRGIPSCDVGLGMDRQTSKDTSCLSPNPSASALVTSIINLLSSPGGSPTLISV